MRFGLGPNQIADLTPGQQLILMQSDENDPNVTSKYFATHEDYRRFINGPR